jgi:DNA helicase II / ATP-dependent DNA helicase PcrA
MSLRHFTPTEEQSRVIHHDGSAFVSACPGAGKTRVLVERARLLLKGRTAGKGIAFLSFTNAAMSELDQRLRQECLLPLPAFPHFVGTFDSFLWQFLVAPFGVPGCQDPPRLIPDKGEITVRPSEKVRELPLECFDRTTGEVIPAIAQSLGFDPAENPGRTKAYMTSAASTRRRLLLRGELDFDDARELAAKRLKDAALSSSLAIALAGRFREVIVDEAQDCNPADLEIIQWLRDAGIATKVVCDPQQSIYEFRGGVTEELVAFGQTFGKDDQLSMSGNFRSSEPICKVLVALRPKDARGRTDRALGDHGAVTAPIHILAYPGTGVPATVGAKFRELVEAEGIGLPFCPVLAATRHSGAKAIGQPVEATRQDLTLRLANAVTCFHFAFETGNRTEVLEEVHRVVLDIEGRMGSKTYHQYLAEDGIKPSTWRPEILNLVRELRYDPATYPDPGAWLARARALLAPHLPGNGRSINQRLPSNAGLAGALAVATGSNPQAKTIHSVKGMEFPAVCVVVTVPTAKGFLDYLETGDPAERSEDARKIYVGASRAQRLLAIAAPRSQAARLKALFTSAGAPVTVLDV